MNGEAEKRTICALSSTYKGLRLGDSLLKKLRITADTSVFGGCFGKEFGCVEMKHAIQRELRRENAGRTWSERNKSIRKAVSLDPHLSRLLDAAATLPAGESSGTQFRGKTRI